MLPPELFFAACLWIGHPGVPTYAETVKDADNVRAPMSGLTDLLIWGEELSSDLYVESWDINNTVNYVAAYNTYRKDYGHYPGTRILKTRFGNEQNFQQAQFAIQDRVAFVKGHVDLLKRQVELGSVRKEQAEAVIALWEARIEFWNRIAYALAADYQHPNKVLAQRQHLQLALLAMGDEKAFYNLEWPSLWDWYDLP